jgi:hypothetical protein
LQIHQGQLHGAINGHPDHALALVHPVIFRQNLLISAIEIGQVFQPRLGMYLFHVWDALTLRNQKKDKPGKQQDHHQARNDHRNRTCAFMFVLDHLD